MLTIYFNDACSKCRATLELVRSSGREYRTVEYLREPPTAARLAELLGQLGDAEPATLTRVDEDRWTELGLDRNPPATRDDWLQILAENPILIQRPIVTDGTRAVIARPPERVKALL
jgi:arsenate reductase